jgi:hypothetical protein
VDPERNWLVQNNPGNSIKDDPFSRLGFEDLELRFGQECGQDQPMSTDPVP